MKIITVIGARPQFIKAASLSRVLSETIGIEEILVHTGQHYDSNMSQVFFNELEIPNPAYNLGLHSGTHGMQTGSMIIEIEKLYLDIKPDMVVVYGDTNSTLAGAIAAAKLHIPLAHVEAGLRSFNKKMPEELNRILTDHVSDLLFTPTSTATENLIKEGLQSDNIEQVGDIMYDATLFYSDKAESKRNLLGDLDLESGKYILATIHRAENTDDPKRLLEIFMALDDLARSNRLVLPLHPRTRERLHKAGYDFSSSGIDFIEPVGYLHMLLLEKHAKVIITDSGGIQKEAYFHGVPCITMRNETEWVELVDKGWNILTEPHRLYQAYARAQKIEITKEDELYGSGDAAFKIAERLGRISQKNKKLIRTSS